MSEVPVLIYDGHCHFCRGQAARLVGFSGDRIKLESFHDPGVLEQHRLTREACEQAMRLVFPDGKIYAGAEAAAQALRLNPFLAWLGVFYYIPGIRQLADAAYRWVALNRFRFGGRCTDDACAHH